MNRPNVIFIYADDLGRGMLSCYGQKYFQTPNIDALCQNGVRFTNAHGCHMCAPARASLLTGIHDCHLGRWSFTKAGIYIDYAKGDLTLEQVYESIHNTGIEQRANDVFLPMVFKQAGYVTGQIGKLEWGFVTTGDEIKRHGWDYHYGYYDHQMCHGYYPPFVFENGARVDIPGNTDPACGKKYLKTSAPEGSVHAQDLFDAKIEEFLKNNRDKPFFLYHPSMLPHGVAQIPKIDPRVLGNPELTELEQVYASMVLRLDDTVGLITRLLKKYGLYDNTLVLFAADNGHCFYYGQERNGWDWRKTVDGRELDHLRVRYTSRDAGDVFDGNSGLTGCKLTNFEGGTRIPLIAKLGDRFQTMDTDALVANYDFMAAMADMLCVQLSYKDGVSFLPLLFGGDYAPHEDIVFAGMNGPALITRDNMKLRSHILPGYFDYGVFGGGWEHMNRYVAFELYDLNADICETNDLSAQYPQLFERLKQQLIRLCDGNVINGTTNAHFAFSADSASLHAME